MSRSNHDVLLAFCAIIILTICFVDVMTGPEVATSIFYLVPVIFCAWYGRRDEGLATALVAEFAWITADIMTREYNSWFPLIWNSSSRFVLFIAAALMTSHLREGQRKLEDANRRLQELMRREAMLARTDPITDLPNARSFQEALEREIARSHRTGKSICLAYIDLDNFKSFNDHYGHVAGDALLRRVSGIICENIRGSDFPARTGGDEFVVLLWDIDVKNVEEVGHRLVASIAKCGEEFPKAGLGASMGIAWFAKPEGDADALIRRADDLMYAAKRQGKGRVVVEVVDQ